MTKVIVHDCLPGNGKSSRMIEQINNSSPDDHKKLIYGVGINDADYATSKCEQVNGKSKAVWRCPFYVVWLSMMSRCYSEAYKTRKPNYDGCYVAPEWLYFMTFRSWMLQQDWENKHLDKDLLVKGNKVYSAETCVFVTQKVNSFITESTASRGEFPIGVSYNKRLNKFQAYCRTPGGKRKHLGFFSSSQEAHQAWLSYKLEQAKILASDQNDQKVREALIKRYEDYNYQDD